MAENEAVAAAAKAAGGKGDEPGEASGTWYGCVGGREVPREGRRRGLQQRQDQARESDSATAQEASHRACVGQVAGDVTAWSSTTPSGSSCGDKRPMAAFPPVEGARTPEDLGARFELSGY